jgi:hypothetical protein
MMITVMLYIVFFFLSVVRILGCSAEACAGFPVALITVPQTCKFVFFLLDNALGLLLENGALELRIKNSVLV